MLSVHMNAMANKVSVDEKTVSVKNPAINESVENHQSNDKSKTSSVSEKDGTGVLLHTNSHQTQVCLPFCFDYVLSKFDTRWKDTS